MVESGHPFGAASAIPNRYSRQVKFRNILGHGLLRERQQNERGSGRAPVGGNFGGGYCRL
jgi:hypothetical protein